jgi:hypothetical protein
MMSLNLLWLRAAHRTGIIAIGALLSACGTYVEPKPGIYREVGQRNPDLTCEYATPTATRFTALQCRRTADIPEETRRAQEFLENQRVHQPRDP